MGEGKRKSTFLIVNYPPQTVTVTPNPPVDVALSGSTTLTCQADGHPAPTFSWKFNGKVLNGAQQNTLTLTNIEVKDAGTYTCIASNFRGSEKATRVVNVEYRPDVTNFTTGTPGNAVIQGTQVTLTCSANGYPAPTYLITGGNPAVSQGQGSPVVINNVQLSHENSPYRCVPTNKVGSGPSKDLTIVVQVPPSFKPAQTLPITKQTKDENQTVSYACAAKAKPAAEFQWMLNGKNLTNTSPYNISGSTSGPSSKLFTTFGYLTIKQLTWQQYGNFSCIAINAAGNVRQNTELEVRYRPVVQTLADHPQNLTLAVGATATFNCKTIGNPPTNGHKWQFNGNDIPGAGCSSCTSAQTLTISSVTRQDAGWYSCIGSNSMGDGPPAKAQLLIKHKPTITGFPQSVYTVNETNNVTMVCRADGVPEPTISWTKTSSDKNVGFGEEFHIINTRSSDDGAYTCTATNELGLDSKGLTLHVQSPPTILTSTPITTNIPGATDEVVELTCIVSGKPTPALSWKRDPKENELSSQTDPKVKGITLQEKTIKMKVIVTKAGKVNGDKYYCFAVNLLGNDTQGYIIRERGAPDPPVDLKLVPFQVPDSQTVSVNVSWTPGYSGDFDQEFSIHYRKKGSSGDFTEESIGHPANYMHTVHQLSPTTEYEFMMQASNQRGKSEASVVVQVMTPDSTVPPDRGTVKATRKSDDPTVIIVAWTVTDEQVTKLSLEMQEGGEGGWWSVPGATDMSTSKTEFKVENLKAGEKYRFRLDMRRPGEENPSYVESNVVSPGTETTDVMLKSSQKGLSAAEVFGIIIGVLVVVIVSLTVYVFWLKRKGQRNDRQNEKPEEIRGSHFKVVEINDESNNENANVPVAREYMALREVTQSQGESAETESSPYLEISDYAPLHPATRSWELPRENVIIEKVIGQGAFGQVAQGTASQLRGKEGTTKVAIKMLKATAPESDRKDLLSELEVMKSLKPHRHVIKLLGCVTESDPLLVIIEYVPYGDLLGYLRKSRGLDDTYYKDPDVKPQTSLTSQQLMKFSWQIADGMSYLSSRSVIHRDLAARNVLVGENETCKVTDFGMARDVHQENIYERKTKGRIPVKWTAYEALMHGLYTTKSDVWSFGVVLYEIFTIGGSPYPRTKGQKIPELLEQGYRMPKPIHVDNALYQIMLNCWQEGPDDRPTFEHLRRELKQMENQHKRLIKMKDYDKKLYENVEDLLF